MMRPFEGFDWGAMALLSKAPQWSDADYQMHAERLQAGLLLPAEYLAAALADPLAERLGCRPEADYQHEIFGAMQIWRHPAPAQGLAP